MRMQIRLLHIDVLDVRKALKLRPVAHVCLPAGTPCVRPEAVAGRGKRRAHSAELTSWIPSWRKRDTFLVQVLHADHLQLSTCKQ
jgi:hypothetical protein